MKKQMRNRTQTRLWRVTTANTSFLRVHFTRTARVTALINMPHINMPYALVNMPHNMPRTTRQDIVMLLEDRPGCQTSLSFFAAHVSWYFEKQAINVCLHD
ncbi:hypothetical protein KIN20_009658 [Parelaphostrongylus tenuis]|uniref:Uncharacterized protein n=1 Tax=Parelaphostrongylus tenuis TaxID=148309 RepID=A0AAD5MS36_PARTN|nr:hypothetical protein KIN20_009658 [Parelaphostrongylus tenuis]